MAENLANTAIAVEDRAIAQILRDISSSSQRAPSTSSASKTSVQRDKPSAPIAYRRGPKKSGEATPKQPSTSRQPKSDHSGSHQQSSRSKSSKSHHIHSIQSTSTADSSNTTELNDTELEEKLKSLVHVLSASGSHHADLKASSTDRDASNENFESLISSISLRAAQQGTLSPSRHQFALFLIALHRRDERRISLYPGSRSSFQVHWNVDLLTVVLDLLITTISASYSPNTHIVHLDSLRALSLVLFDTAKHYSSYYGRLLACLRPLCDVKIVLDKEVQRVAFNCLTNMCYKSGSIGQSHYEEIWAIFMRQTAQLQPQVLTQISFTRVFSALLRGIQFIIPEAKGIHEAGLPSLVSMLHKFIFYGTPLGNLTPTLGTAASSSVANFGGNVTPFKPPLSDGEEDEDGISTGSEYSGSDVYSDKHGLWKVRFHSLGCLQALARTSSEKFIQFWAHLLPQSTHQPSLISIVQIDSVHQVRSAACRLLSAMFDGQHNFLDASNAKRPIRAPPSPNSPSNTSNSNLSTSFDATSPPQGSSTSTPKKSAARSPHIASPKSFTPFSMQLSTMLQEVHLGLYKALATETRPTTIVAIVKTFGVLAQETPYDSLTTGTLTKLLLHLQRFVMEGSIDMRLTRSCVSTLASCVGARSTSTEAADFLKASNSALVLHMETMLLAETNSSIKTEIFRFFSSLASHFPMIIIPHWNSVFKAILATTTGEEAQETDPNTRHAASKCVDDLSRTLLHCLSSSALSSDYQTLETFTTTLWQSILTSRITELMVKDRFGLVRSSVCNLFSQIPPSIFVNLSRKQQVICITLLLGAVNDDVPAVRSQAARALGLYILNNALKMDPLFVSDVALALVSAMKDKNLNVRVKAAWSAANLCDSLVTLRESPGSVSLVKDEDNSALERVGAQSSAISAALNLSGMDSTVDEVAEELPKETLITLVKTLLLLCKDNDKVRCNAVRALGNFIRFASERLFEGESILLNQITDALHHLTKEGSAKVRWNSCYALANLFHNRYIVANMQSSCSKTVETLLHALNTSTNFKVRINAATALYFAFSSGVLDSDEQHTASILNSLVSIYQSIEELQNEAVSAADQKYRDSLRDQLRTLAIGCIVRNKSIHPSLEIINYFKHHQKSLEAILCSALSASEDLQTSPEATLPPQNDDQDEITSHSQLNPPTTLELRTLAQDGLSYLASLST